MNLVNIKIARYKAAIKLIKEIDTQNLFPDIRSHNDSLKFKETEYDYYTKLYRLRTEES